LTDDERSALVRELTMGLRQGGDASEPAPTLNISAADRKALISELMTEWGKRRFNPYYKERTPEAEASRSRVVKVMYTGMALLFGMMVLGALAG